MGPVLGGLLLICFVFRIVPKFQEFKMLQDNEGLFEQPWGMD